MTRKRNVTSGRTAPDEAGGQYELFQTYGTAVCIRSDNGPELVSKTVQDWLKDNHVDTHDIDPGSPCPQQGPGDKEGVANSSANLGGVCEIRADLKQAKAMFQKGKELFKDIQAAPQVKKVQELLRSLKRFV